jgi:hypothetical protein
MIQPTVGRVVLLFANEPKYDFGFCFVAGKPHAALVTAVHSDTLVNVVAFDANGKSFPFTSIELKQAEDQKTYGNFWCEWMPYQKGQAAKAEALEKELAAKG